jgi:hypothetical protein
MRKNYKTMKKMASSITNEKTGMTFWADKVAPTNESGKPLMKQKLIHSR